jgi:hypothetical protein
MNNQYNLNQIFQTVKKIEERKERATCCATHCNWPTLSTFGVLVIKVLHTHEIVRTGHPSTPTGISISD